MLHYQPNGKISQNKSLKYLVGIKWDIKVAVTLIKNFNIVKIDSKGRIILPFHIRDYLGLKEGMELLITNNEKNELRVFPMLNAKNAKVRILMNDMTGSLFKVLSVFGKHHIDIMMSTSQTIEKGKTAEWSGIIDISNCKDIKKLENEIKQIDVIKKFELDRK